MTSADPQKNEEQASASSGDANVSDVITAWNRVFQGFKAQVRTNATLFASDFRLSIKAVVVTLISILILVGLVLVVWVTLLAGLTYGLTSYGFHWLWSFLLVLVLNVIALKITKQILNSAIDSINMTASAELLLKTDCDRD
jgi:hypothetical protein